MQFRSHPNVTEWRMDRFYYILSNHSSKKGLSIDTSFNPC